MTDVEDIEPPRYYSFNPETGEHAGGGFARRSPADKELTWMCPGHTTLVAPPDYGFQQTAVWNREEGAWSIVPDHRGETWYRKENGKPVRIAGIGDPTMGNLTPLTPPIPAPAEAASWDEGKGWQLVPDLRGHIWFDKTGKAIEVDAIGDPAKQGLMPRKPDLRSDDQKLVDARAAALAEVRYELDRYTDPQRRYPQAEILTWPAKVAEAALLAAGGDPAQAPLLALEASKLTPPISLDALAAKVLAKAQRQTASGVTAAAIRADAEASISPAPTLELVAAARVRILAGITSAFRG